MTVENIMEGIANLFQGDSGEKFAALKGEDGQWKEGALEEFNGILKQLREDHGEEQRKRGVRERGSMLDKSFRSLFGENYELPKSLKGEALYKELAGLVSNDREQITELSTRIDGKEGELSLEEIFAMPEVKDYMGAKIKEGLSTAQSSIDEWKAKYESEVQARTYDQMRGGINSSVEKYSAELGLAFDWGDDKALAVDRKKRFLDSPEFSPNRYIKEGDDYVLIDENGDVVYNDLQQKVTLLNEVERVGKILFPVKKYESNPTPKPETGGGSPTYRFKNGKEYREARGREKDPVKRKQMADDFLAQSA